MIRPYDRDKLRRQSQAAKPVPFMLVDDFLEPAFAEEVARSYPTFEGAIQSGFTFNNVNEQRKVQVTDSARFPEPVKRLHQALASRSFLADLAYITGIPNLIADEQLAGGGMHITGPGGRLDVHVDFNYYEERKLHRRLNILVYLNPGWQDDWGGDFELWDKDVKTCEHRFKPILNRCVVFETSRISYHGVRPVTAPEGELRKSFAAYYYTQEAPAGWNGEVHSTIFRARPDEKLRGLVLMPAERVAKQVASVVGRVKGRLKRTFGRTGPE